MNAQPYATITQADTYFGARPTAAEWDSFDEDEKKSLLLASSDFIDVAYEFKGRKTDPEQEREFPRTGIEGVPSNTVPNKVIMACCELALFGGNNDGALSFDRKEWAENKIKVDVIEIGYDATLLNDLKLGFGSGISDYVDMLLRPFLSSSKLGVGSGRMARG